MHVPKWHQELDIFYKVNPLIIMEGNVLDRHIFPISGAPYRLPDYLSNYFTSKGYVSVICYNSIMGFYHAESEDTLRDFAQEHSLTVEGRTVSCPFIGKGSRTVEYVVRAALNQQEKPTAIILDLASRYVPSPASLSQQATDAYTGLLLAAMEASDVYYDGTSYKNLLVVLVNKSNDIPPVDVYRQPYS